MKDAGGFLTSILPVLFVSPAVGILENWGMIRGGMCSRAVLFVAQMQDWLDLGAGHRMNVPGTGCGNWTWRLLSGEADKRLAKRIHEMTRIYGRL